jgi:signal transduction histidine kinase
MSLMISLQALAILTVTGAIVFVHVWLGPVVPPARMLLFDVVYGGFNLWWAVSIVILRVTRKITEDTAEAWYGHTTQVFWFGNVATVTAFALVMPYASEALRLVVTMVCLAPVAVEAIGTILTPRLGRRDVSSTLAPAFIPVGIVIMFAVSGDEFAIPVMVFVMSFTIALLLLREVVQGWVDYAWDAAQAAEAARDARTRFLASASHDLGQPLQAARLFFDQVLQSPAGPARERAVRNVRWAFDNTEHLLGQMMDHLRLESGEVEARLAPLPLGPLIARVAEMHEPAARLKGVDIDALPTRLVASADSALVERALGNLVANAIRHAKARRVLVGARRKGDRVRVWVIDNGVGIPDADRPRLFEDHVQGSNHGDEIRGGFGLGLASCRRIAELMGGSAGHEPRWSNGAAFWIDLPLG